MFDSWLRPKISAVAAPVTGLRYFNVYGPGEAHKGRMASVVHQFDRQIRENGSASSLPARTATATASSGATSSMSATWPR